MSLRYMAMASSVRPRSSRVSAFSSKATSESALMSMAASNRSRAISANPAARRIRPSSM